MGLTCSLLGHRFGDPVVEQDREERESEAVTVTREVVVCERCGERRLRSESTEVAAVADPDGGTTPAPEGEDSGDVADDEAGTEAVAAEEVEDHQDPESDLPGEEEPTDEGAEILTDESSGREFGEWPEAPEGMPDPSQQATDDSEQKPDDNENFEEAASADDRQTRLTCPDCGFDVEATGSPLRAGDACPDCGEAYLAERNQ